MNESVKWKKLEDFPELKDAIKKSKKEIFKTIYQVPFYKGVLIKSTRTRISKRSVGNYEIYITKMKTAPILITHENKIYWINLHRDRVFESDIPCNKYRTKKFVVYIQKPLEFF